MSKVWTNGELALKAFLESAGHELCEVCRCCDAVWEVETCWMCGGCPYEADDDWDEGGCSECRGEGEISYKTCLGRCTDKPHGKLSSPLDKAETASGRR